MSRTSPRVAPSRARSPESFPRTRRPGVNSLGGLALLLPLLLGTGCPRGESTAARGPESPAAITLIDGRGIEVKLARPATRVVCLTPSATEILCAVGGRSLLVRRDDHSDHPPDVVEVESVGSTHSAINIERVLAVRPDLVLASGSDSPIELEKLEKLGLTVYASPLTRSFDDLYADLRAVGRLCGRDEAAAALIESFRKRVARVVASRGPEEHRPTVFFDLDSGDSGRPWTCGPGSIIGSLLELAGARNIAGDTDRPYFQMSLERLVSRDPELIIRSADPETRGGEIVDLPGWRRLRAVREGRILEVDENLIVRPGPRLVDGLELIARHVDALVEERS